MSDEKIAHFPRSARRARAPKTKPAPEPTDDHIADAFADEHRNDLRYVAAWGKWFEWRGGCWREEKTLRAFDLIRKTCKAQGIERGSMAKMVGAVHTLARADRRLAATIEQWDADPMLLNTPDGVVDLEDRRASPAPPRRLHDDDHRRRAARRLSEMAGVPPPDHGRRQGADRLSSARRGLLPDWPTPASRRCSSAMASGPTARASSCTPSATSLATIARRRPSRPSPRARPTGTRPNLPAFTALGWSPRPRPRAGRHWAEARIKMLTGGDVVTAHFMRQDDFEYTPRFKLFFSGNHKPGLRSVGEAMRRRVNMIPFAVVIPKDERDPHFGDRLEDEWPGVLQWMIDGCLDWQERGLAPPEAVTQATDDYFTAQDSFTTWIEECCERDPNAWTMSTPLFGSWKAWAEKAGVRFGDIKSFGETMEAAGFVWKRKNSGKGYEGLRLVVETPPHWQDDR